ncbi:MAG: glycerophosphoryl diester phosphodiesterase membrane domain-containing protein [Erythrobacter sp.]
MSISVGNVFSTGIEMFGKRALKLAGLWLIFTILSYAVSFGLIFAVGGGGLLSGSFGGADPDFGAMGAGLGIGIGLVYLISFYISGAQMASMASMGSRLTSGDFGTSFTTGFTGGLTLMGVFLLFLIGGFVIALPFSLFADGPLGDGGGALAILPLLLLAAMVFLTCRLCLVFPVVGVDGVRNPITAITRSWQMTKGSGLKIFLILIIFFVILMVLVFILSLLMGGVMMGAMAGIGSGGVDDFGAADIGSMIGVFAGVGLVFLLVMSVIAAFTTAIFAAVHSEISGTEAEGLEETFV